MIHLIISQEDAPPADAFYTSVFPNGNILHCSYASLADDKEDADGKVMSDLMLGLIHQQNGNFKEPMTCTELLAAMVKGHDCEIEVRGPVIKP